MTPTGIRKEKQAEEEIPIRTRAQAANEGVPIWSIAQAIGEEAIIQTRAQTAVWEATNVEVQRKRKEKEPAHRIPPPRLVGEGGPTATQEAKMVIREDFFVHTKNLLWDQTKAVKPKDIIEIEPLVATLKKFRVVCRTMDDTKLSEVVQKMKDNIK